jgi:hypothetical protein
MVWVLREYYDAILPFVSSYPPCHSDQKTALTIVRVSNVVVSSESYGVSDLLDVNGNLNAAGQVYVNAAKKVVSALPNPSGSGTGSGPAKPTGPGYVTVTPAQDTGLTPSFARPTGSSARRLEAMGVGNALGFSIVLVALAFGACIL